MRSGDGPREEFVKQMNFSLTCKSESVKGDKSCDAEGGELDCTKGSIVRRTLIRTSKMRK